MFPRPARCGTIGFCEDDADGMPLASLRPQVFIALNPPNLLSFLNLYDLGTSPKFLTTKHPSSRGCSCIVTFRTSIKPILHTETRKLLIGVVQINTLSVLIRHQARSPPPQAPSSLSAPGRLNCSLTTSILFSRPTACTLRPPTTSRFPLVATRILRTRSRSLLQSPLSSPSWQVLYHQFLSRIALDRPCTLPLSLPILPQNWKSRSSARQTQARTITPKPNCTPHRAVDSVTHVLSATKSLKSAIS